MATPGPGHLVESPDYALAFRLLEPAPDAPRRLLLLLHGVGGHESQLAPLGAQLDRDTLVVLPRAPRSVGEGMFGWFRVAFAAQGPRIVPEEAEESRKTLVALIGQLQVRHAVPPERTVVAGFSQGGILSASVALTAPRAVAGFAVLCGRILPEIEPRLGPRGQLARLHALVVHGRDDDTLPVTWAERADAWLGALGVPHAVRLHDADAHRGDAPGFRRLVRRRRPPLGVKPAENGKPVQTPRVRGAAERASLARNGRAAALWSPPGKEPEMPSAELDNPFWSALATRHRAIARSVGEVARYPADYAPFLGIAHAGVDVGAALDTLVAPGESLYLLGVAPHLVPDGWRLEAFADLAQMTCTQPLDVIDGPEAVALGAQHRGDVLALTALVYPHYFRERTMELGRYVGFYVDGRLAAMAGERLGTDGHTELSAICTHPDFSGRGYARRLTALLTNDTLASGRLPFLHVSYANTRARGLYESLGYRLRRNIGFWQLQRA